MSSKILLNRDRVAIRAHMRTGHRSTVTIITPSVLVNVSIDLSPPRYGGAPDRRGGVLRVHAVARGEAPRGDTSLTVTLEPYRPRML